MKIAKAPTDEDHGYLFIYVGMEYIFSKAQEAEVEKQLREAGGNIKSRKQKPWDGDIIGTKRKNNSQNDDNGWAFVEDMVSQEMSNRQDIL